MVQWDECRWGLVVSVERVGNTVDGWHVKGQIGVGRGAVLCSPVPVDIGMVRC